MKIKQLSLICLGVASASILNAAIGISGTSLNGATSLAAGDVGVYVISDGTAFSSVSIATGANILDSASYGAGFTVLGSNTATSFGGTFLGSGHGTDISFANASFAVFVFEASTTTAIDNDSYNVWTDSSWTLPTVDGNTFSFAADPTGTEIQQLNGASTFGGTVGAAVPEPSTFAALTGLCALGAVMVRRRRA